MTTRDCLPLAELEALAALPAGDARRAHLDACPRCRGLLASYALFMDAQPGEGARVTEADEVLAAAFARELAAPPRRAGGGAWPGLAVLFAPAVRPMWAAAAVALVVFAGWQLLRPPGAPQLRGAGEALARVETLPAVADADSIVLRWRAAKDATQYEVRFFRMDLGDLAALPTGTATTLALRRGALPAGLPAHERVLWQVLALKGHDIMARSKTQPVDLP